MVDKKKAWTSIIYFSLQAEVVLSLGADSSTLPLGAAKAGRNQLNKQKYPPPPDWNRRAICPDHIKYISRSALAPM
jgi:hypothetical protein